MRQLHVLWRFSRPHTVIGSIVSILTLYVIVCARQGVAHPGALTIALIIGVTCNLFITGINQLADVELDRVNKPTLPLPAGDMSPRQGWWIVGSALGLCLALALVVSGWLFALVLAACSIGWAYSMPPFRLKRHHAYAASAIATVRGAVVNLGGFVVYDHLVNGSIVVPREVWLLACFVFAFSIVIAWFKDLPDMRGDALAGIRTMPLHSSPRTTLIAGHALVGSTYLMVIGLLGWWCNGHGSAMPRARVLFAGHVVLLLLFMLNAAGLRALDEQATRRFYMRFWWFFFAEYVLFLLAYISTASGRAH